MALHRLWRLRLAAQAVERLALTERKGRHGYTSTSGGIVVDVSRDAIVRQSTYLCFAAKHQSESPRLI